MPNLTEVTKFWRWIPVPPMLLGRKKEGFRKHLEQAILQEAFDKNLRKHIWHNSHLESSTLRTTKGGAAD